MNEDWEELSTVDVSLHTAFYVWPPMIWLHLRCFICDCSFKSSDDSGETHKPPPIFHCLVSRRLDHPAEMSGNGGSAVGLLSYETLVHAVAGAMVRTVKAK